MIIQKLHIANQIRQNESERKLRDTQRAIATFGKPSKEFLRLNPSTTGNPKGALLASVTNANPIQEIKEISPGVFVNERAAKLIRVKKLTPRTMSAPALNKTEQRWQNAHPDHIPFPLRLRWGNCMHYKPDFLQDAVMPVLIEVKGAHIFSRDICRFKGCAAEWDWLFAFEMWQWKNKTWTRIY